MRFNCHTHIFNLKSVFTRRTLKTLLNRLGRENWPDFVIDAVEKVAQRAFEQGFLDEADIVQTLVGHFAGSKDFKSYMKQLDARIPADVQIVIQGDIEGLAVSALRDQLRRIGDLITDNRDAENQTLSDLVGFLTLALKPTIADVADTLLELSGDDTAAVALMLDITEGGRADEALFLQQIEKTSAAALAHPGRILPFVAVNPLRDSHFTRMDFALTQKGCVGIKLYPALGHPVDSDEMDRVFAYCAATDVPVLLHCSRGGFYFSVDDVAFGNPAHWEPILEAHPGLRVCFGHFGGDENLVKPVIPPRSWTAKIIELMKEHDGVYADISFHTAPMAGGDPEKNYFRHLAELLSDARTRDHLLFGSDFYLVRQRVREDNLWRYFEKHFTAAQLRRLTETNPTAFLGLPAADGTGARPNIQRHLNWLAEHHTDVQRVPAGWALTAIAASVGSGIAFSPSLLGPAWSVNNQAHIATWDYMRVAQMLPSQQMKPFNQAGLLRLRELKYWNKEHESPNIFAKKVQLATISFDDSMNKSGIKYEKDETRASARDALRAAFENGDTALHEFAATVDRIYRFASESDLV